VATDAYSAAVLADAPNAYWRLGEAAGATAIVDASGNGFGGTVSGPLTFGVPGALFGNSGLSSNTGGGKITTTWAQTAVTSYTIETWVNTTSTAQKTIATNRGPTLGRSLSMFVSYDSSVGGNPGKIIFAMNTDRRQQGIVGPNVADGKWHHIVGTWSAPAGTVINASQFKLYVDSVPVGTPGNFCYTTCDIVSPLSGVDTTVLLPEGFDGKIDDFAVYTKALTQADVNKHFAAAQDQNAVQPTPRVFGVSHSGGVLKNPPLLVADPVNSATGAFDHSLTDMSLPGRGEELSFGRNYDSRQPASSSLGKGWWHPYFQSVAVNADGVLSWTTGTGSIIDFAPNGSGGFTVPAGVLAEASVVAGGGWKIVSNAQTTYTFNAAGRLVGIVDRSGQGVSVAYDAAVPPRVSVVSNGSGKSLTLTYGTGTATTGGVAGTGRLVQVKGSDNRTVKYAYTGASGTSLLTSVTDVRGKVWLYAYDANGFLEKETDPNTNVQFTNTFDVAGRVVSQKDQLNNVSSFAYNDTAGTTTLTDAAGAVRVWNRLGNVPNGATDPAGSVSTEFNAQLDAVSFTDATQHKWTATYDARGNMLSRTAPVPLLYSESWTYDGFNNPLTYVDARGNTTTYGYDPSGRLLSEARPGGVSLGYTWNSDGTLATSTDPRGGVTTYAYDTNGWLLSQVTPLGFKTSYTYDAAGRVLTITEPRGNVVGATATNFQQKFTYDADGNVLTEKDALNRTTTHVYDNGGRRSQSTAPDGGITRFEYNAANELVKQIAPDGGVTDYEYDNRGLRTKETSPIGAITTFKYDAAGRLEWRVDSRGNEPGATANDFRWSFTYDAAGRQKTVTDPLGRVTTTNYDQLGRVLSTVRPDGTTSQVYDQNGNVTSTTTEAGTVSQVFDPLNRVESSTDLRGKTTSFGYDLAGNRTRVTDPLLRVTTYVFDADGRMSSMVDARGTAAGANPADFATSFLYDEAGNQVQVTDPLGLITKQVYDRVGNVTTSTNAKNLNTTFVFDSMNRTTRVTAPVVGATNYTYTTMGYVATRSDPLSTLTVPRVSSWLYDLAGRTTEKKDAAGRRFTFGYDVASNQTTIVDANANAAGNASLGTTTMTFDRLNRLTQRSYSDGTSSVSYVYDVQGRMESMTDGVGTTTYGFDAADRVSSMTRGADVWAYGYDTGGNITSRQVPGGANSTATFDDAGQLATLVDPSGTTTLGYDKVGNPTQMLFPNGVTQARTFDRASRLATIANTGPGGLIGGFAYTRDANGNPTAVDVSGPGGGVIVAESMRHTYDNADRLTKTCFTTTTCATANQTTWTFNTVGSRLTEKIGSAAVSTYTYDVADQLTAITGPGAATFTYNPNGDQLTAGADTFTYNTARQTTSATVAGVSTAFTYDGSGNRATVTAAGAVTTEVWDTMGGLPTLVAQRNAAGVVQRRYTYMGSSPIKYEEGATVGYYQTDGLGSVSTITTATGTVGATYRYNPYGTSRPATSVLPAFASNPMRYTGQQLDPTGNYNLRARHYNPGRGAFTQTDPAPYGAGHAFEASYVYGGARPTVMVDPSGRRFSGAGFSTTNNSNGGSAAAPAIAPGMGDFCRGEERFYTTRCLESWLTFEKVEFDEDFGPGSSNNTPALELDAYYGFDKAIETQTRVYSGQIWEGAGSEVGHRRAKVDEVVVIGTITGMLDPTKKGAPDDGTGPSVNVAVAKKNVRIARRVSFDGPPSSWRRSATHKPILSPGGRQYNASYPASEYNSRLLTKIGKWISTDYWGLTVEIAL
jgi:RHS repeat-associated protein